MKLWAISDIHLNHRANREALAELPPHPDDWLIIGGDVGESAALLEQACEVLGARFRQLVWVPGNHELWAHPREPELRGVAKYEHLVALCRRHGVLTPEDPYALWEGEGGPCRIAPLFLLYDYSFRPPEISREQAIPWAVESEVLCADEAYLHPDPYESRDAWCAARVALSEARLAEVAGEHPLVLVNHFPLRQDLVRIPRIPRFSIWCGTRRTEDWHRRFGAKVVVTGHLHVRATDWIDGVRFEEVSLGYPRHWRRERGVAGYLREILPGPAAPAGGSAPPRWRP